MNQLTSYAVITGDIIGSRRVKNRIELQSAVEEKLSFINTRFAPDIAVNFQVTLGDEFQGMVKNLSATPIITSALREQLYSINVRLSIGIGPIATKINKVISKMDGPAFHLSREGIGQISQHGERITIYLTSDGDANHILKKGTDLFLLKFVERNFLSLKSC